MSDPVTPTTSSAAAPDALAKATTVVQTLSANPALIADAQAVVSKLPPKVRAAIYDTGVALGVASSVGVAVIAVLTGQWALLGGEVVTLFGTVQSLIAKAHVTA